ncbi:hypothetical protein V9T40_010985 [Parthenolecanium corni]|uniref:Uncharacterized protein n=1 Tax=Parthenolecanium corni TaxID=536013 RepID=A0AAN9XY47_9HEMI
MDNLSDGNEITVQSFDLNDQLSNLRNSLEQLCNTSLADYSIWLQGSQQLSEDKSLVDHGIEGEGDVQVKLQINVNENGTRMINIIDVLKLNEDNDVEDFFLEQTDDDEIEEFFLDSEEASNVDKRVQWVEAKDFVSEKKHYNIPTNPHEWSINDVKHWLHWAIKTFDLKNINMDNWNVNGEYICRMTSNNFVEKVPEDINNDFWTHILVLQTCGQVMVRADQVSRLVDSKVMPKKKNLCCSTVNLWKFLLELLTDKAYRDIIRWVDDNGEFQMVKPDSVARLWGEKKQKNNMTYEKLSRALRYYSDGDLISKVPGKRFVYKFHFDIKEIVGYSPMQLNKLINDD